MAQTTVTVIKANGEREPFSEKKVRRSIRRARVPKKLRNQVLENIKAKLYDGIPTREIYSHISDYLEKSSAPYTKGIYSLKQAIMQLGPSGFPFEKFVARVLEHHGYQTQTNFILKGKCVEHEIDVIAEKNNKRLIVECKHHTQPGARSDLKVVLYTRARFEDLSAKTHEFPKGEFHQVWLVTNTKATTEAIKYAECTGMKIIGWNYPTTGNLQDLIESAGLLPITCLSSLTQEQKKKILGQGFVLCRELLDNKKQVDKELGLSKVQRQQVMEEAVAVCMIEPRE